MNPAYGIFLWVVIGALAGWIASKIMGTNAEQGGLANVLVGVVGAVVGGFLSRTFLKDELGNNGLLVSFGVALVGACLVIFVWKTIRRR
jgi:uncharacterized membrane protein YeaQ/YmgE (transglycosylase-associated protein family)